MILRLIQPLHWREQRFEALCAAVEFNRPEAVEKLLVEDCRWALASSPQAHRTALMIAASHGHLRCAELLMGKSDARMADKDGETALMLSATHGDNAEVFAMLLPDSDVGARNIRGRTALGHAARKAHVKCIEAFFEHASKDGGRLVDFSAIVSEAAIIAEGSGFVSLASWMAEAATAIKDKGALLEELDRSSAPTARGSGNRL